MTADLHSHILPGLDDGSHSPAESIELLKMEAAQGIDRVMATPHFYARHDRPEVFLVKRKGAEMRLREEMEKHPGLPRVAVGAEVHYFCGMSQSEALPELTMGQSTCILVELDEAPWGESVFQELEHLSRDRGFTPVIAHVERYMLPFSGDRHLRRLMELPVLMQANAGFFLNVRTRHRALGMLEKRQIHVLGSDCHDLLYRPPRLGEAVGLIQKKLGHGALEWLCTHEQRIFGTSMDGNA